MEILNWVAKYLKIVDRSKNTRRIGGGGYLLITIAIVLPVIDFHIWKIYGKDSGINGHFLVAQLLVFFILWIWLSIAPNFQRRNVKLESCFECNKKYSDLCSNYQEWSRLFPSRKYTRRQNFFRAVYMVVWLFSIIFILIAMNSMGFFPNNFAGIFTLIMTFLTLFLNMSSYYLCTVFMFFLYRVSWMEKDELKHNYFLPSATKGFQMLSKTAYWNSIIFLLISLLYAIICFLLVYRYWDIPNGFSPLWVWITSFVQYRAERFSTFLVTLMISLNMLLGFASFLVLYLAPQFFLRNILGKWKALSLRVLEDELLRRGGLITLLRQSDTNEILHYITNVHKGISKNHEKRDIIEGKERYKGWGNEADRDIR